MRRITLWLFFTVAALMVLFNYHTSTNSAVTTTAAPGVGTTLSPARGSAGSGDGSADDGTVGESGSSGSGSSGGDGTYAGSVAQTRWGPVQVTITVGNGRIVDVAVPTYPVGNRRDEEINAYALPVLRQETLAAQGAGIDAVSGATVTSDGYKESLQAALDAAHLS